MSYGPSESPILRQVTVYPNVPAWDEDMLRQGAGDYVRGEGTHFSRDHTFVKTVLLFSQLNQQLAVAHQRDEEIKGGLHIRAHRLEEVVSNISSLGTQGEVQQITQIKGHRNARTQEDLARLQKLMERAIHIQEQLHQNNETINSKWDEVRSALIGVQNNLTSLEKRVQQLQNRGKV